MPKVSASPSRNVRLRNTLVVVSTPAAFLLAEPPQRCLQIFLSQPRGLPAEPPLERCLFLRRARPPVDFPCPPVLHRQLRVHGNCLCILRWPWELVSYGPLYLCLRRSSRGVQAPFLRIVLHSGQTHCLGQLPLSYNVLQRLLFDGVATPVWWRCPRVGAYEREGEVVQQSCRSSVLCDLLHQVDAAQLCLHCGWCLPPPRAQHASCQPRQYHHRHCCLCL